MKQNPDYLNFLKDKRVIIVGPAESLLERGDGQFIDSFDIVVRVNRGIEPTIKNYNKLGSRTDILYNCMLEKEDNGGVIELNLLKLKDVKYVSYHSQVSYQGKAEPIKPHQVRGILTQLYQRAGFGKIHETGEPGKRTYTVDELPEDPALELIKKRELTIARLNIHID